MKFTTLMALLGIASADLTIKDQDIKNIADKYAEWGEQQLQTRDAQMIAEKLEKALNKAVVKTDLYANKILEPLVNQISADMKRTGFPTTCDVEQFAQCIIRGKISPEQARNSMCALMYRCQIKPTTPMQDAQFEMESQDREQKFNQAVDQYFQSIGKDLEKAAVQIQGHVNRIGDNFASQTNKIMKDAGCDPSCTDMCTSNYQSMNIPQCFSACDCPELVTWKPEPTSWEIDVGRVMAVKPTVLDLKDMEPLVLDGDAPPKPAPKKEEPASDPTIMYGGIAIAGVLFCMFCVCNKSNDVDDYDQEAPKMDE